MWENIFQKKKNLRTLFFLAMFPETTIFFFWPNDWRKLNQVVYFWIFYFQAQRIQLAVKSVQGPIDVYLVPENVPESTETSNIDDFDPSIFSSSDIENLLPIAIDVAASMEQENIQGNIWKKYI